jgi:hypothetical protein
MRGTPDREPVKGVFGGRKGADVFDASVLARLMGWSGGLRVAGTTKSKRIVRSDEYTAATIDVTVVGDEEGIVRVESPDEGILEYDGRTVAIDFGTGMDSVRLEGSLEILSPTPPILAALHPIAMPERLQRRQWVRVSTYVAARVADADAPPGGQVWYSTTTNDLSPGGTCLRTVGDFRAGQRLRIDLRLASGQVELIGTVLRILDDGTTRIQFSDLSESDMEKLTNHPIDIQVGQWYPYAKS